MLLENKVEGPTYLYERLLIKNAYKTKKRKNPAFINLNSNHSSLPRLT